MSYAVYPCVRPSFFLFRNVICYSLSNFAKTNLKGISFKQIELERQDFEANSKRVVKGDTF